MAMGDLRSKVGAHWTLLALLMPVPCQVAAQAGGPVGTGEQSALRVTALASPSAGAAALDPVDAESTLRQAAQQALWPADIARLCADYLRRYPQQGWAADADRLHQRAAFTADLLQQADVPLFRQAFDARGASAEQADDLRLAALGDPVASWRIAQRLPARDGSLRRHVGWLQYAARLGSDEAAYALALHYRRDAQPLLAARYEARAIALGFQPPPALDHRRR